MDAELYVIIAFLRFIISISGGVYGECWDEGSKATVCQTATSKNLSSLFLDTSNAPKGSAVCVCYVTVNMVDVHKPSIDVMYIDDGTLLTDMWFEVNGINFTNKKSKMKVDVYDTKSTEIMYKSSADHTPKESACLELTSKHKSLTFDLSCYDEIKSSTKLIVTSPTTTTAGNFRNIPNKTSVSRPNMSHSEESKTESHPGYLVPVLAAVGGAIVVLLICLAILIPTIRRARRAETRFIEKERRVVSEYEDTDTPMPEDKLLNTSTKVIRLRTSYVEPADAKCQHADYDYGTSSQTDAYYTQPHDVAVAQSTSDINICKTKSFKAECKCKPSLLQNVNADVYDHTTDSINVVPMHLYDTVGHVSKQDALNTYDTTVEIVTYETALDAADNVYNTTVGK